MISNPYFSLLFLVGCSSSSIEEEPRKELVTVSYVLQGEVVNTVTVQSGSKLGVDYIYDFSSHQEYAPTWKDESGKEYNKDTIVDQDTIVEGSQKANLNIVNELENDFVKITGINHVHQDGKLVLLETYYSKNIVISENALSNNGDVVEIYFPRVINHIYSGNFQGCDSLTTIYYEGTMEQFDGIPKEEFVLPSNVHMIYNTSFANS